MTLPLSRWDKSEKKLNEINAKKTDWRSLRESNPSFQIENLTS